MGKLYSSGSFSVLQVRSRWSLCCVFFAVAVLMCLSVFGVSAQSSAAATVQGTVVDASGKPVDGASVRLEQKGEAGAREAKTSAAGGFAFPDIANGRYVLSAQKSGAHSSETAITVPLPGQEHRVDLILKLSAGAADSSSAQAMEFADNPNFTVAGVTDWTAVGGHGSDISLRTSEDLTRKTITLKPQGTVSDTSNGAGEESESKLRAALASSPGSFEANHQLGQFYLHAGRYREAVPLLQASYRIDPANSGNEYDLALACEKSGDLSEARDLMQKLLAQKDSADVHRLLGDVDEKLGDPLTAVHEYERAARLDPSEQNYFEWGSELLLHRAVWQAEEVFANGAKAYPKSARMLAALGTALFAGARYEDAAQRLCDASDLSPEDPELYNFMGRIEIAAPEPLACVEQKLARFVRDQPKNAAANYLYAMAIWKRQEQPADPKAREEVQTLLTKAVTIDPQYGDAYLQLGNLSAGQKDYSKAIGFYTRAIEVEPQLVEAHYRLGVAYDRMGETAKAKAEFQLHDEIEKQQAAAIEQQRREIKQYLVVLQGKPTAPATH
jgi:tetratricopeptide (TPR) repeat protein